MAETLGNKPKHFPLYLIGMIVGGVISAPVSSTFSSYVLKLHEGNLVVSIATGLWCLFFIV
jgi:hypothetical protein